MPLAPGRLSMTMGCDQASVSFWPTARARMSVVPPAEKGTTIRTGLPGYCAAAENAASAADSTSKRLRRFIMGSPQERTLPAMIVLCKLRRMLRALAFLAACTLALAAGAQAFPAKPLRLVVGYPPGGSPRRGAVRIRRRSQIHLGAVQGRRPGRSIAARRRHPGDVRDFADGDGLRAKRAPARAGGVDARRLAGGARDPRQR